MWLVRICDFDDSDKSVLITSPISLTTQTSDQMSSQNHLQVPLTSHNKEGNTVNSWWSKVDCQLYRFRFRPTLSSIDLHQLYDNQWENLSAISLIISLTSSPYYSLMPSWMTRIGNCSSVNSFINQHRTSASLYMRAKHLKNIDKVNIFKDM